MKTKTDLNNFLKLKNKCYDIKWSNNTRMAHILHIKFFLFVNLIIKNKSNPINTSLTLHQKSSQ